MRRERNKESKVNKGNRLEVIKRIIQDKEIKTQNSLIVELGKEGFKVTQATISRDIQELKLVKESSGRYVLSEEDHLKNMLQDLGRGLDSSRNLIVVQTLPGAAQTVASAIDGVNWEEVIGTVAGDDTILIVGRDEGEAKKVKKRLGELMLEEESNEVTK